MSVMDSHIETLEEIFSGLESGGGSLEDDLREAEETLSQMKIELHTVNNKSKKDEYLLKMQQFNKLLMKYRKQALVTPSTAFSGARTPLTATERNANGLETLKKAHEQLAETEQVGVNVLSNLAKQKETIKGIQGKLNETNSQLGYSNKLLNRMSKWYRVSRFFYVLCVVK